MINKALKDYADQIHNIDFNYETILSKSKGDDSMKPKHKKILNIAAIFLVIVLLGALSPSIYAKIQWNIQFKEYQNREYEYGIGTIKEAVESGYYEIIQMDSITQDGICAKVDSLMITDDYLEAKIDFTFADNIELDSQRFSFGYAIYDDENNIYGISTRMHIGSEETSKYDNYWKFLYEELGVNYNKKDVFSIQYNDASNLGNISANDRNIVSKLTMESSKGFPKSKKIYLRIFDLGYSMVDLESSNGDFKINAAQDFSLSDAEWIFEIDVPEKFYQRETVSLTLKDDIPGLDIEKITVSEVSLVVKGTLNGLSDFLIIGKDMSSQDWENLRHETIHITDSDGNVYYDIRLGTTTKKDGFNATYGINKNDLEKQLFLNVKIDGVTYSSELVKK